MLKRRRTRGSLPSHTFFAWGTKIPSLFDLLFPVDKKTKTLRHSHSHTHKQSTAAWESRRVVADRLGSHPSIRWFFIEAVTSGHTPRHALLCTLASLLSYIQSFEDSFDFET